MSTSIRCFFLGKPPAAVRNHLCAELERLGLQQRLGGDLFAPLNWHQSLSDRFEDGVDLVERLLSAGAKISARAVRFRIDRIESRGGPDGVHWEFKPERTPPEFDALPRNMGAAIASTTGCKQGGHTAHLTLSYWAPEHLPRMVAIRPIEWVLDEVLLVRGGGSKPYRYEVVEGGNWALQPPRDEGAGEQLQLL